MHVNRPSKYCSTNQLLIRKQRTGTAQWGNRADSVNQVIKINITKNGTNHYHLLLDMIRYRRTQLYFGGIPVKNKSIHEETNKPKLRDIAQNKVCFLMTNLHYRRIPLDVTVV